MVSLVENLRSLQSLAGVLVGIVMCAIGAGMMINSFAKLYLFGYETGSYFNAERSCAQQQERLWSESGQEYIPAKKNQGEGESKEECMAKETRIEMASYTRNRHESLIDGGVLLLVGGFLWVVHRRLRVKGD